MIATRNRARVPMIAGDSHRLPANGKSVSGHLLVIIRVNHLRKFTGFCLAPGRRWVGRQATDRL